MTGARALDDSPARRLVAEFVGTALLLLAVVGSGVATSVDGAASTQLFQHAVVVGVSLAALVVVFLPVSGAHFNPAVTLADVVLGGLDRRRATTYVAVQFGGAVTGTLLAHAMFGLPAVAAGTTPRTGGAMWLSELVATAGLVLVIVALVRAGNLAAVPLAVGGWVAGAIFFTSSMSFANPAVTIARTLTDSWTGIVPTDAIGYLLAQFAGAVLAAVGAGWLFRPADAPTAVTPTAATRSDRQELP